MASARRRKNYIRSLNIDGELVENRGDILEEVVEYFKGLFSAKW